MTGMVPVSIGAGADLDGFRDAARRLVGADIAPGRVAWNPGGQPSLFADAVPRSAAPLMLPKRAAELIRLVVCHSDPERYGRLYTLIWRLTRGERALLEVASDPLVHRLDLMAKAVRRDLHKMHAFVRFRRLETAEGERFVAWFEPDHFIVEATAGFFVDRFRGMDWAILTPKGSLHWDRTRLAVGPSAERPTMPEGDGFERGWLDYYEATFNPARVNPDLMRREMPTRYWKNLPEAALIPGLIQDAPARAQALVDREAASPRKRDPVKAVAAMAEQAPGTLAALNRIIAESRPPAPFSPRAVLGEGPMGAAIALVGEQPGDQEDLEGRPFVGPAGQLLDRALAGAGLSRRGLYVTNAVKHFKHELRGKRRLHKTPTAGEVKHYRWWLQQELRLVRPSLVVALGATATLALAGRPLPIISNRGPARFDEWPGFITVHPSYLLRLPDPAVQREAYAAFVRDLRQASAMSRNASRGPHVLGRQENAA